VQQHTIAAIRRICKGLGQAAGLPDDKLPLVTVADESAKATYNDPTLTRRQVEILQGWIGSDNLIPRKPVMGAEDFGLFGRTEHKIPISMLWLGSVTSDSVKESMRTGKTLPSLHSAFYAPVPEPTIKTGVTALTAAVLELTAKK
jgi:hippurate hydrolase